MTAEPNFTGVATWARREAECARAGVARLTRQIDTLAWWRFDSRCELKRERERFAVNAVRYEGMAAEFQTRADAAVKPLVVAVDGDEARTVVFGGDLSD